MADYSIPMSSGPQGAAEGLNTNIALNPRGAEIPTQVQPFKPIDVGADMATAYKRADDFGKFQENQAVRSENNLVRESKQRDQALLQAWQKSGHSLYSEDDLTLALHDLGDKLSPESQANLVARRDAAAMNKVKFQELTSKLPIDQLEAERTSGEFAVDRMSSVQDAYTEALKKNPNDMQGAAKAFEAAKQANLKALQGEVNPATGKPVFPPQILEQIAKATPDTLPHMLESTKHGMDMLNAQVAAKLKEANVDKAMAETADLEKKTSQRDAELKLKQQKTEAAIRKAAAGGNLSDEDAKYVAVGYRGGDTAVVARLSTADKAKVIHFARLDADANGDTAQSDNLKRAEVKAGQVALNQLEKQMSAVGAFEKTASKQLDLLQSLGKNLDRDVDIPLINKALTAGQIGLDTGSSPAAVKYYSTLVATQGEIAKILSGSTGAQGATDQSRREAADIIQKSISQGQLEQLVPNIKLEMKNRMDGYKEQRSELLESMQIHTGGKKADTATPSDFPKVTPDQQKERDNDRVKILQDELAAKQKELVDAKTPEDKNRAEKDIESLNRELGVQKGAAKPAAAKQVYTPEQIAAAKVWLAKHPDDPKAAKVKEYVNE